MIMSFCAHNSNFIEYFDINTNAHLRLVNFLPNCFTKAPLYLYTSGQLSLRMSTNLQTVYIEDTCKLLFYLPLWMIYSKISLLINVQTPVHQLWSTCVHSDFISSVNSYTDRTVSRWWNCKNSLELFKTPHTTTFDLNEK